MNARSIVFASLGGMLILVIALLFVVDGSGGAGPEPTDGVAAPPPASSLAGGAGEGRSADTRTVDPAAAPAAERPGPADGSGSGTRPETGPETGPAASPATDPATDLGDPAASPTPAAGGEPRGGEAATEAAGGGSAPGTAEPQETVEEVLRATARRYEGIRSLRAGFEQRLTNTLLGRTTRSTGTLYQRQPDRFLMEFSDPEGDVIVSDGEYFWLYYPSADPRQVIRSSRGAGGLDLRSQFVGDPVRRFEATSHGRETVRGREAHVITLEPREPVGYRRLKVWIDAADHLVRRFELTEDNGNIRRFELTDVRVNPSLPDDLFRFEPPAGAVVVTR